MNAFILKILSLFPQVANAVKVLEWLLAESGYWQKVATYLAAETEWYFKLAAVAWGELYVTNPDALKPVLLARSS